MKDIYQDDFSTDVSKNEKPRQSVSKVPTPSGSAKQAPPPIKKTPPKAQQPVFPDGTPYPAGYPPVGFYPQPIFYQPDPSQPQPAAYPVYYAPYPPGQFPVQQPPTPAQAPTPAQPVEALGNEAGTRVLFQSDDFDFDKKEESFGSGSAKQKEDFTFDFDVTEERLSSVKRAPAPTKNQLTRFKVDEMEMGTYEFNIMTAGQASRAKNVLTPTEELREMSLKEESLIDEVIEEEEDIEIEDIPQKAKKTLPTSEIIRRAILGISIVAIIIASASLLNEYRLHKENENLMSDLSDLIITDATTETTTSKAPDDNTPTDKNTSTTVPTTLPLVERPLSVEEQWEILRAENPNIVFPEGIQLRYAKLYAQNTDFVGYLSAPGSDLSTPVVQGENDKEYVEKNFYGESTKYACPFVTSTNNIQTLDENTVIFGHHMRDGSIFGTLDQYRTVEGYKKAPVINFNTIYGNYDFKVIATFITNINPKQDNNYVFTYYWTNLYNEVNHTAYLSQLSQRSLYDTGVDVNPTDKLLTLSTCCKDFDDARLVVVARLVRPGETTLVDTSRAVKNANPRFPQAYYDKKNKKNPYADAYKWQIS